MEMVLELDSNPQTVLSRPLGERLQQAGLLSCEQVDRALELQAKHPDLRLGEIAAAQGWLSQQTADFFAEDLPKLSHHDCRLPIGHYFKSAALLDDARIAAILANQARTGLRFGETAVRLGLVCQETVDVMLACLRPAEAIGLAERPRHASTCSHLKRAIDILGALVGLGITGAIFVPLAIAIKLDSPGPVLFSQIRVGDRGKTFRIWKFRSMVSNAELVKHLVENRARGQFFKNENDPRITRIGRFIRRTSLDEFPQFWNILKGDMSLVGTRPPTVDEVVAYEARHWQRLEVKPGLTGEWQANGRSRIDDFEEVVALDLDYQRKWSVLYDLYLIAKTILVVFDKKWAC